MASQQSSRAALITSVVVLSIVAVTALIFAFIFSAGARKAQRDLTALTQQYNDILERSRITSADVQSLASDRQAGEALGISPNSKLLDVALIQRDLLAQYIAGGGGASFQQVVAEVQTTLSTAATRLANTGVTLPSTENNLVDAVDVLATAVDQKNQRVKQLEDEIARVNQRMQETVASTAAQISAKDQQIAAARQEAQQIRDTEQRARQNQLDTVAAIQRDIEGERRSFNDRIQELSSQLGDRDRSLTALQKELAQISQRLAGLRTDPSGPIIRTPDGAVTRLAGNNLVYIDRGLADQIVPGMTFEVYDKIEGIPANSGTDDPNVLPRGKASIEVIRLGQNSAEARIVRLTPGANITDGDLIANLVYDPHVSYRWHVYGEFDVNQDGRPDAADAEIIKRLITSNGGQPVDEINVNTDFVVMGIEPELPAFTSEELLDPINRKKLDDAQARLNAYNDVLTRARDLYIPVLNQNRFLYYIGYYSLASR